MSVISGKTCPSLPELAHLHWSTNETRCQTQVSPTCDHYYQLVPSDFTIHCTTDEEWNVTDVSSAVRCECKKCLRLDMYLCMYVCMFVYIYVCTCFSLSLSVCLHVCMYEYMYICLCVCMYVCMYINIYIYIYVCVYVCIYVHVYIVIQCQVLPKNEFGYWVPYNRTVTTQTKLQCWDNATLVNSSINDMTCLITGDWDKDPNSFSCRRKFISGVVEYKDNVGRSGYE